MVPALIGTRGSVGMISHNMSASQTDRPALVTYSSAGTLRTLPVGVVRMIAGIGEAAPVPFAPPAFEGLVATEFGLAAQMDLGLAWGGPARAGRMGMLVGTSVGLVRVRVDTVALAAQPGDAAPSGLAEIESLVAALAPADPESETRLAEVAVEAGPGLDLLMVASGATLTLSHSAHPASEIFMK